MKEEEFSMAQTQAVMHGPTQIVRYPCGTDTGRMLIDHGIVTERRAVYAMELLDLQPARNAAYDSFNSLRSLCIRGKPQFEFRQAGCAARDSTDRSMTESYPIRFGPTIIAVISD